MELGPKQKEWIKWIRENESKYKCVNSLGSFEAGNNNLIECCILGSLLYLENKYVSNSLDLIDNSGSLCYLTGSYEELGLYDKSGTFKDKQLEYSINSKTKSLSEANDELIPWNVIANFIEDNPEAVFNKSY